MSHILQPSYTPCIEDLVHLPKGSPINLVLSGGGVKGVAHLAALKKIEELGLKIESISGSSAGALVGAMYASGTSVDDIFDFFANSQLFRWSWLETTKPGLFEPHRYLETLQDYIKPTFEELEIPLYVSITNLETGLAEYRNEGELREIVLASCAFPGVFVPISIENTLYADGGIMDNFPIFPFYQSKGYIIGSYVEKPKEITAKELKNPIRLARRSLSLNSHSAELPKFHHTQFTFMHNVGRFHVFDFKHIHEILQIAMEDIKQMSHH
ncbi:MAG: patatin-like phospholipase family protein [Flavobacteriales bacterium]|jgi:NTE family protein|nr:patatin-like phospholipase family protein [Flavobacteriales bacterium]